MNRCLPKINQTTKSLDAPHVVILGAGASKAAFPRGDKNGKHIPLMNELVPILKLEKDVSKYGLSDYKNNFELLYSIVCDKNEYKELKILINKSVRSYFSSLEIPECATIYDYLILSLKDKDLIATFNWDPFLLQAYIRNIKVGNLPKVVFLHGNVSLVACEEDISLAYKDSICSKCNKPMSSVELLFPVTNKDYNSKPVIKSQWSRLSNYLDRAYFLTIFGYSAPESDVEAIEIMKKAWIKNGALELAEVEIIDIKNKDAIIESWRDFKIRDHYGIYKSIKDSWLWRFPRESGEALFDGTLQNDPLEAFPFPETKDLKILQDFSRNIKIRKLRIKC